MTRYVTIQQAAEALSVSEDTIRRMLPRLGAIDLSGGLAGKRMIRIPENALRDYLAGCVILPPFQALSEARKASYKIERRKA